MVVADFNIAGASIRPSEADTELIVDADAPLTCAISTQCLKPICGWMRRSAREAAASNIASFRMATVPMCSSRLTFAPEKKRRVAMHRKDRIGTRLPAVRIVT
jgi:hypothetical protein